MGITTKPRITGELIGMIRRLIAENPGMGRSELSQEVCRALGWQSPSGYLKEISCRDMLRALDKAGSIALPPPKTAPKPRGRLAVKHVGHDTEPVACGLASLLPVTMEPVQGKAALAEFKSLIDQYHYLGFDRAVGENMKYAARSKGGKLLAVMLFGSAAWSCADRDEYIGWSKEQRAQGLQLMTNNARFLIPPWVAVRYLASHALSLAERRISRDWQSKYGHPLAALETFVERRRFKGSAYRAANWELVGRTAGRGRDGGHHCAILPVKDIYVRPLRKDFRELLKGERQW